MEQWHWLLEPGTWISLLTLTVLEIVLGIDNVVFISILAGKLPPEQQEKARRVGLSLALITRVLLLFGLTWVMGLSKPLFSAFEHAFTGRDLILISGGLFLLGKATHEIHEKLEGEDGRVTNAMAASFTGIIIQILLLDVVFSLDSVITAVGMAQRVAVMIAAVVIAVGFMLAFSGHVSRFIERHPTFKMLALSFLLLIGVVLVADGFGQHIQKGYVYFAMAFSVIVEILNLRLRKRQTVQVPLRQPYR